MYHISKSAVCLVSVWSCWCGFFLGTRDVWQTIKAVFHYVWGGLVATEHYLTPQLACRGDGTGVPSLQQSRGVQWSRGTSGYQQSFYSEGSQMSCCSIRWKLVTTNEGFCQRRTWYGNEVSWKVSMTLRISSTLHAH